MENWTMEMVSTIGMQLAHGKTVHNCTLSNLSVEASLHEGFLPSIMTMGNGHSLGTIPSTIQILQIKQPFCRSRLRRRRWSLISIHSPFKGSWSAARNVYIHALPKLLFLCRRPVFLNTNVSSTLAFQACCVSSFQVCGLMQCLCGSPLLVHLACIVVSHLSPVHLSWWLLSCPCG